MIPQLIRVSQLFQSVRAVENVYLHLPFCRKKCHFCAFPIHAIGLQPQEELLDQYINSLKEEIQISKPYINLTQSLKSIYFGGGTPSLHSKNHIRSILQEFAPTSGTEITVEVNPSELSSIQGLLDVGVNRISLGIQSFNSQILNKMGRHVDNNSQSTVQQALSKCRPSNLNVDFILNFTVQDSDWKQMTDFIQQILPEHLTIYILEINEGSKVFTHPEIISQLPKDEEVILRYIELCEFLKGLGYDHYEVSNFSRSAKYRSIHSSTYWSGNKEYLAYGMGATSLISGRRITRPRSVSKYSKYINELKTGSVSVPTLEIAQEQSVKDILSAVILSGIRTSQGILWSKIKEITDENEAIIAGLVKCIVEINEQRPGVINAADIEERISLNSPLGFLLGDEIGFRLIESLEKCQ